MRISKVISGLLLFVFATLAAHAQNVPEDLDAWVGKVLMTFDVPGISVAIVKDGEVLLARGYGIKKMNTSDRVDEKTLFGIASNTKAFTATAVGLLVEEGKLQWDAPVIDYLPWFRLSDPYVTKELTIRDLLVHRSGLGLGAGDLLWWPTSTYDRKEIVRRLRYIPLATSFRSAYAYDNVLYSVAGEVIEAVSGQSWEEFVYNRILMPVGMKNSNVRHSASGAGGNVATTHAIVNGELQIVKPMESDNTNPAGGINTNAEDIAKWMIVQLDSGRLADGNNLFEKSTTRELWKLVTPIPFRQPSPELAPLKTLFNGYALGFNVKSFRGHKLVTHTGGLPGYLSRLAMIPDLKLGVAVLTNQESGAAFNSVAWHVLDHFTTDTPHDWITAYQTRVERWKKRLAKSVDAAQAERNSASKPSLDLEKYVGTYRDTWYGDAQVSLKDGRLELQFIPTPELVGGLEHWQYDSFVVRWYDRSMRADAYVYFTLKPDGTIDTMKMKPFSRAVDFSFDFQDLEFHPVN